MTRIEQYEKEKRALDERLGLIDNKVVRVDLSLMKILCPRANSQARSYIGLTNYCFRVYGATIIITSQRNPTGDKT